VSRQKVKEHEIVLQNFSMKIITIPDLHGKDCWKSVDFGLYDKVVFLGDYVDSSGKFTLEQEINNLEAIMELKKAHPEKIELLLGNHDILYLYFEKFAKPNSHYEGKEVFIRIYNDNKPLFSVAYQYQNHLWTHAGVSNKWLDYYSDTISLFDNKDLNFELGQILNKMHESYLHILATKSPIRGGQDIYGGIFFADKSETSENIILGLNQYVGHTKVPAILKVGVEYGSISFLDCLNIEERYLVLELS